MGSLQDNHVFLKYDIQDENWGKNSVCYQSPEKIGKWVVSIGCPLLSLLLGLEGCFLKLQTLYSISSDFCHYFP